MSGEIIVPETPNWLKALEEKREQRLKARLGHEAGAGAPCLKCNDKCSGLDLHFWRKCCKICRCAKEEHDVHDDDIYGWAQFQLLGSKPNKIKTKIVLPGRKDEVELEWAPKGNRDIIDKYLKTLPPDQLPVRGSQAAQDRKQMLQKQIPIHDIDPALCHELNEDEMKKMKEYIAHVKEASVGVGQIVNLSGVIKGNLNLSPQDAAIIASRYSKGIPLSEIVRLQGQSTAHGLPQNFEKLSITEKNKRNIPSYLPKNFNTVEDLASASSAMVMKDINHPYYNNELQGSHVQPQYSSGLQKSNDNSTQKHPNFDPRTFKFDPKNIPSQFNKTHSITDKSLPYHKTTDSTIPLENYINDNVPSKQMYAKDLGDNLLKTQHGFENPYFNSLKNVPQQYNQNQVPLGTTSALKTDKKVPAYASEKYDIHSNIQKPVNVPQNIKDLVYSTYDPNLKCDDGNTNDRLPEKCNFDNRYNSEPSNKHTLTNRTPNKTNLTENIQEPYNVNIGPIKDITYPEIRQAVECTNNDFIHDYPIEEILNNIALPNCHYCKKPFEENEFAVSIDRSNALFHSHCFKCSGCNQNLADNVYFYDKETDNIYCGRDYAKIRGIVRCKACDELIFTKEYCLAENSTFHLKHFCCFECDTPLAGQDYVVEEENPYCLPCSMKNSAKCSTCLNVIRPDEQGCQINGVHFHATDECFACIVCRKPLMGSKLLLRHEKLFCSHVCLSSYKI